MVGHTPGPWRIEADMRSEPGHYDGDREYLAGWNILSDAGEVVGIEGIIPSDAAEANARLIAAAPELLEACEVAVGTGVLEHGGVANILRAVISKARGEVA